jgi:hypothetical protein
LTEKISKSELRWKGGGFEESRCPLYWWELLKHLELGRAFGGKIVEPNSVTGF